MKGSIIIYWSREIIMKKKNKKKRETIQLVFRNILQAKTNGKFNYTPHKDKLVISTKLFNSFIPLQYSEILPNDSGRLQ